jgi:hypothetical protein
MGEIMKISTDDIKVGLNLKAFDAEETKWLKAEIYKIDGNVIYLKDIDPTSDWQGMEWETNFQDIQDTTQYKQL